MSIFFEVLVRIASYGPQIDQSHGENRFNHIIRIMEISEGVIRRGRNTLLDLHNSSQDTQPHSLIVK